jgi:pimeloyl-ACP methyl ester carboxylesterase
MTIESPPIGWRPIASRWIDGFEVRVLGRDDPDAAHRPRGPVVVFAHGMDDGWSSWLRLSEALPGHYSAYALDLPWRAGTDYAWADGGDLHKWVAAGLDALPTRPSVLIAHSLAATATLHLMGNRPVGAEPGPEAVVLVTPMVVPVPADQAPALFAQSQEDSAIIQAQALSQQLGRRRERIDPEIIATMARKLSSRPAPRHEREMFWYCVNALTPDLAEVRTPTLVVSAADDPLGRRGWHAATAFALHTAGLRRLSDCGHSCHLERPDALAEAVVDFITENIPSATADTTPERL